MTKGSTPQFKYIKCTLRPKLKQEIEAFFLFLNHLVIIFFKFKELLQNQLVYIVVSYVVTCPVNYHGGKINPINPIII